MFGDVVLSVVELAALVIRVVSTGLVLASVHALLLVLPVFGLPSLWLGSKVGAAVAGDEEAAEPWRRVDDLYGWPPALPRPRRSGCSGWVTSCSTGPGERMPYSGPLHRLTRAPPSKPRPRPNLPT